MGVIYKILKQQREQHNMDLTTATKHKVQAAIKQRQQQQQQLQQQQQRRLRMFDGDVDGDGDADGDGEESSEHQLHQLCQFLAENAARNKRLKLSYEMEDYGDGQQNQNMAQNSVAVVDSAPATATAIAQTTVTPKATTVFGGAPAPRDSILLKIRHQIMERKRQRQRQLADLVQHQLVVWRPW